MLRATGLVLIFAGLALGETQNGTVTSAGQPIPGATVVAVCGADRITTITDDAGRFEMGGLPSTPCRFSVAMFGFDSAPREATASATALTFDLRLQAHATLPRDPNAPAAPAPEQAAAGGRGFRRRQNSPDAGNAPQQAGTGNEPGRGGFGRGGPAARTANGTAANAQAANQGFQNLSLLQNGDNQIDSDLAPGANPTDATGANEAFLVNGSLSQGVQAQPGDNFGLGGPGGFGRGGFEGPGGGAGNPFGAQNGATITEAQVGGPGGPGGEGRAAIPAPTKDNKSTRCTRQRCGSAGCSRPRSDGPRRGQTPPPS